MTQDEIIEMVTFSKRSWIVCDSGDKPYMWQFSKQELETFVELVAAKEREACAKVCESHGPTLANSAMLAEQIRARGVQ